MRVSRFAGPTAGCHDASMATRLPLATLLSQVLTAFIIEADNEAEHRMAHRTTRHGATSGASNAPWLVSLIMWANCLRHLPAEGVSTRELERRARTPTNLAGMERWGYISVRPDPTDPRANPPRSGWLVRPKPGGLKAQQIWQPLVTEIEDRWKDRFGVDVMASLREWLSEIDSQIDAGLPECLPILGYGLFSRPPNPKLPPPDPNPSPRAFFALLSRILLAFAIEFESGFAPSLAICANLLRLLDPQGVRVRDLPVLSGVSKESLQMAMGIVTKSGLAGIGKSPDGGASNLVRLTSKGVEVRMQYQTRVTAIEEEWRRRFGSAAISGLRNSLEHLAGDDSAEHSPLFRCIVPYPDGWRAAVRKPTILPHFPMVMHRGGFPDGS